MARYYSCIPTCTRMPRKVLSFHSAETFVSACIWELGETIGAQARAILVDRQRCEKQNPNALDRIRRFALERDEDDLALALGDYFDRLAY